VNNGLHTDIHIETPDKPAVSVIIPTYNCSGFLAESIRSVLAQTFGSLEVVVVDDGSTDDTAEVVAGFESRVRYVHQNNSGTAAARNTGIRNARADVIAFLDHDDLWLPGKLEQQMPVLTSDTAIGMVFCGRQFFNTYTGEITSIHPAEAELGVHDFLAHDTIALQSAIVPRSVFERVGLFDETLLGTDDWEMCIRIAERYRVVGVPDVLVNIRGHSGQQGIMSDRMFTNSMRVLEKHSGLHLDCLQCRDAIRQSKQIIREDYYQRRSANAKKLSGEGRVLQGAVEMVRGLARYPEAITRIPKRVVERFTGRRSQS